METDWRELVSPPKYKVKVEKDKYEFSVGRPWNEGHDIILRWYDHWLKGIDKWCYENEWPLAITRWTKFYLRQGGRLTEAPPTSSEEPDSFTNLPTLKPRQKVPCVEYTTEPMAQDIEITGPSALYFHASLSNQDANWMAEIFDISPDVSRRLVTMG